MKILLLSDIHGNYPALKAVTKQHPLRDFDIICNCGDSTVYGPFPNEVLDWLRTHGVLSIRGNTDDKVVRLLKGKDIQKPGKPEKRIMYTFTAEVLTKANHDYLKRLKKKFFLNYNEVTLGFFHGSPLGHEAFLFDTTPERQFADIATEIDCSVVVTGHSHTPYHKHVNRVHFINPGSVGRMFDGNPQASYAILQLGKHGVHVSHFRCDYNVNKVVKRIRKYNLPEMYCDMFRRGKKLN
ncbi:MAG: YfcE family phosphodiesterase [Desulfobulbus propionicus]|nr:MAG: YfcE family phosphodiesterase [Desulfobulbus propionicus]